MELEKLEHRELLNGRELTVEVLNELFAEHFGPEKRNTVRGYGIGVEWADVPGILTEKEMVANDVGALRSQVEDSREEIARLREESAKKDEEMIVIKTKLTEIEARLQTPLDGLLSSGVDNIQKLIAALTQAAEKHSQPSDQEMHSNAVPFGGSVSLITH